MATKKKARKAIRAVGSKKRAKKRVKKTRKAATPSKSGKKKRSKPAGKVSYEQLERYAASLEKRLKKYEKKRFQGPLMPGVKRRKPSRAELDDVRSRFKLFLDGAKRSLEELDIAAKYRSHENADFSIDAELRVPIDGNGMVDSVCIDVEEAGNWNSLSGFWIMMGLTVVGEELTGSPTIDKRPNRAWTNPVRGSRAGAAFFTIRETVFRNLENYGGDVNLLVIRLYWHPDDRQPSRPRK